MKNLGKVAKETKMLTGMNGRMQINYDGETVWSDYFPDVNSWEEYHDGSVHFFTNRPMTAEEIEERLKWLPPIVVNGDTADVTITKVL